MHDMQFSSIQQKWNLLWSNQSIRGALLGESRFLTAASEGDPLAFEELVRTYDTEVRRFVLSKVNSEAVDDVMQEIWIAAWSALPRYDRRGRFRTWLYAVALNKCYDHYRSSKNEKRLVSLDHADSAESPMSIEADLLLTDSVRQMVDRLTQHQREVVELYYFAQLTLPEIASALNRNLNTVKYQFYRAHAELLESAQQEKSE